MCPTFQTSTFFSRGVVARKPSLISLLSPLQLQDSISISAEWRRSSEKKSRLEIRTFYYTIVLHETNVTLPLCRQSVRVKKKCRSVLLKDEKRQQQKRHERGLAAVAKLTPPPEDGRRRCRRRRLSIPGENPPHPPHPRRELRQR